MEKLLKNYKIVCLLTIISLLFIDRYFYAQVAQWREDQSTNLWLGFNLFKTFPVVGLLSSVGLFNPNGMAILAWPLSFFPNLTWISFFLGVLQLWAIYYFSKSLFLDNKLYRTFFLLLTLSSVTMRGTGNEFWNQWMLTPILLISLSLIFNKRYFVSIFFIFLFPAIYLAGMASFISMFVFLALYLISQNELDIPVVKKILIGSLWAFFIWFLITWLPFLKSVNLSDYSKVSTSPFADRVFNAFAQIYYYPKMLFNFATIYKVIYTYDIRIMSVATKTLFNIVRMVLMIQSVVFIVILLFFILIRRRFGFIKDRENIKILLVCTLPMLVFFCTSLMGGPKYASDSARLDQVIAFVPIYYLTIFILPLMFFEKEQSSFKILKNYTYGIVVVFVIINILAGIFNMYDHLSYTGNLLSNADVPLTDKRAVIDFIGVDWKKKSQSQIISVDYDLAGNWEGVTSFGQKMNKFYNAPMTIGRSYDYELKRIYDLSNSQEGSQDRKIGDGNYIISYAHETKRYSNKEIVFGRLKLFLNFDKK